MKIVIHTIIFLGFLLAVQFVFVDYAQTDARGTSGAVLPTDTRVMWLKKNAVSVRTVDPKDQDFSDLMPLEKAIGNARIVMLGESGHGDGATALGKSRLVEFLHQKMGFDVLVFEGGLYDMTKVWSSLREGDASLPSLRLGIMPAWSGSEQSQSVFDYIAANGKSRHPLEIAGFDSQVTGTASRKYLVHDLTAFLNGLNIKSDIIVEGTLSRKILDDVINDRYWRGTPVPEASQQDEYLRNLQQLENKIIAQTVKSGVWQNGFWIQELHNLRNYSKQIWLSQRKDVSPWELDRERDKQGADNLLWLANERYRGHKLIVWAATWHVFRNKGLDPSQCAKPEDNEYCKHVSMGQHVWERLGHDVYVIGFTAYGGNKGFLVGGKPADATTGPLKEDQDPSIEMEELFNAAGFEYAFLNLQTRRKDAGWLKVPIRSRPLGNQSGLRNWSEALDAIFFIRRQQYDTRKSF